MTARRARGMFIHVSARFSVFFLLDNVLVGVLGVCGGFPFCRLRITPPTTYSIVEGVKSQVSWPNIVFSVSLMDFQ